MQGFIFGGDTGETPESVARKRQIAARLAAGGRAPQNVGEGIAAIGDALAGVILERRAKRQEAEGRQAASEAFQTAMGGFDMGAPPADAYAAPAASPGRSGGSRSWRNNNPGNLEFGPFAERHGATGSDGRFAIFPDEGTGRAAMETLLFDSPSYSGLSLEDALNRYAPPGENDVNAYMTAVGKSGVAPDAIMGDIAPEQRAALVDAMIQHEGWTPGRIQAAIDNAPPRMPMQDVQPYEVAEAAAPGVSPALIEALGNPWLTDAQRSILAALVQKQIAGPETMDPYQRARLDLAEREFAARQAAGGFGTPTTNVTVDTGEKSSQFGEPPKGMVWLYGGDGQHVMEDVPGRPGMKRPVAAPVGGTPDEDERMSQFGGAVNTANTMLGVIDGILNDEQLANATGWGSFVPVDIPGVNARVRGRMAQIEGQLFLQAFESLKGGGQITEVEGRKATQAMARLNAAQTYEDYKSALNELRAVVEKARDRANERLPEDRRWEPDAPAPSGGPRIISVEPVE